MGVLSQLRSREGKMSNRFNKVNDTAALEQLYEHSRQVPVILFKHSLTCPISSAAYSQMQNFDGEVALVEVQTAREVSQEIARRTGLRHESPQVIVLRNGQAIWDASHFRITADAVSRAVRDADTSGKDQASLGATGSE
jgi:bacillithiol system protein YtxJ